MSSIPDTSSTPLSYMGLDPAVNPPFIYADRPPTVNDQQLPGTIWQDNSVRPPIQYRTTGAGVWDEMPSGAGSVNTIEGNSGGSQPPVGGNFTISGGSTGYSFVGSPGELTLTGSGPAELFPISPYVVGPVGKAGYQTIQSAITAASAAGGGTVYIQPGTYTENLTLQSGVELVGAIASPGDASPAQVLISGTHTLPSSGEFAATNLYVAFAGNIFTSTAAGTTNITLTNIISNPNGYLLNIPNWTTPAVITLTNVSSFGGRIDGVINHSGGAITCYISNCPSLGGGTDSFTISPATLYIQNSLLNCNLVINAGLLQLVNSYLFSGLTIGGTAQVNIFDCAFYYGSAAPITFNSTSHGNLISTCTVLSHFTPAIAGTGGGILTLTGIDFPENSGVSSGISSVTWGASSTGDTTITGSQTGSATAVSASMSPYTVTANDFRLCCDSGSGDITIILPTFANSVIGRNIIIEDAAGFSSTNPITVNGNGNSIISGGSVNSTQIISTAYGVMNLTYDTDERWIAGTDSALASRVPITPYVVSTIIPNAYQSIQSAINAAHTAGGGTVYIQPGTYTENLTLQSGVELVGAIASPGDASPAQVLISGTHTLPSSGEFAATNLYVAFAGNIFTSTAAGTTNITLTNIISNPNGYLLNIPNWTTPAVITLTNVSSFGGRIDGVINHSGGAITCYISNCPSLGGGTDSFTISPATLYIQNSLLNCNLVINAGLLQLVNSYLFSGLTIGGTAQVNIFDCAFYYGSAAPITFNSTSHGNLISTCTVLSHFTPAIAGTGGGILTLTGIDFPESSGVSSGISSVTWGSTSTGAQNITGNLSLTTPGNKLFVATGFDASIGQSTLVGGTMTVSTSAVDASSLIFLTNAAPSGTIGTLSVGTITPGTSFVINSSSGSDTSLVNWWIIN